MRLQPRSLYARLALGLLLVLGLAGSGLAVSAWWHARIAADEAYDQILVAGALQIAENIWMNKRVLEVDVPLAAFSVLAARDQVFYQVLDPARQVVAGDPALQVDVPWAAIKRGPVLRSASCRASRRASPSSVAMWWRTTRTVGRSSCSPKPWSPGARWPRAWRPRRCGSLR